MCVIFGVISFNVDVVPCKSFLIPVILTFWHSRGENIFESVFIYGDNYIWRISVCTEVKSQPSLIYKTNYIDVNNSYIPK